jgi:hypothetical protein
MSCDGMGTTTMSGPAPRVEEPTLSLPTGKLLATVLLAGLGTAGLWWLLLRAGLGLALGVPAGAGELVDGLVGIGLVLAIALVSVVVMTPWKTRPMSAWMNLWLAGTVLRLLLTPPAAFVLYSAASFGAAALTLSVAAAYIAILFSEAIVLSLHLKRTLPGSSGGASGSPRP